MVASNGYGYRHGTMARAAVDLDSIDEQLNDIRRILETECALPSGAFGWGPRWAAGRTRSTATPGTTRGDVM
ncbi:hypothetical protein [Streptosporangium sandarakinum]